VITVNRVKGMVRDDVDIKSISTEACFAVAKATELFLEGLADKAASHAARSGHDGALEYADVAAVVAEMEPLSFLADIVPQTVKAAALLDKMKPAEAATAAAAPAAAAAAAAAEGDAAAPMDVAMQS